MHTPGDPSKDALQPNPLWASRVLEALAAGEPLPRVLELLLSSVHAWCPDCGFALLLNEPEGAPTRCVAHAGLPLELVQELEREPHALPPGASEHGFVEAYAEPIATGNGGERGLLIALRCEDREPMESGLQFLRSAAQLAGVAIGLRITVDALSASEAQVRAILDTAVDAIVTIDERGTVESFNRAAERMFGWSAQEVIGRNVNLLMPSPDAERHDGYLERFLQTGEARIIGIGREVVARRKDGSPLPVDLGVSELSVGGARKFTGILRDLSERKRLEEEFLSAQKMEAIGRLAGGIAHDFNNLLMGIIGCSRMGRDALPEQHPASQALREIADASERGAGMTRQLLSFSRPRKAQPEALQLNRVVTKTEAVLRGFLGEDIELVVVLAPSGGPVFADASQLEQVLMNLIVNARDAMPEGGRIGVHVEDDERSDHVLLVVEDSGCGMDRETLERAFEPFFTTKCETEGTGLGLATVYGIVKGLGGRVGLESKPGRGTVVRVQLPRNSTEPTPRESDDGQEGASANPVRARGTILLVEDDRLVRAGVRHQLTELGFEVLAAEDPAAALRICDEHEGPIQLLLTDIVMPGMSGYDLSREVLRRKPGTPALYMSALPNDVLVEQGRLAPGLPSIEKPFTDAELRAALCRLLDAHAE